MSLTEEELEELHNAQIVRTEAPNDKFWKGVMWASVISCILFVLVTWGCMAHQ